MGLTSCGKSSSGSDPPGVTTFSNPVALHISNLRKDSDDQFANTPTDCTKPQDFDGHALTNKGSDSCLNVEGVAT